MSSTSIARERSAWQFLSSMWTLSSICVWLYAFNTVSAPMNGSQLTLLALIAAAVGVMLRLKLVWNPPEPTARPDPTAWLLGYAATANWLGYLLLRSSSLQEAIPAIMLTCFAETWLAVRCLSTQCCAPWLMQISPALQAMPESPEMQELSELEPEQEHEEQQAALSDESLGLDDHLLRTSTEGLDEEGRRFCAGKLRARLEVGQASEEIVVGFCPAFSGDPDIDFEMEVDSVEATPITVRLINCTPAGMRLVLRRTSVDQRQTVILHWYAVAVSASDRTEKLVLP